MKETKKTITIEWGLPICSIITSFFTLSKVLQIGICKDWSWWQVFSPLWGPIALIGALLLAIVITILLFAVLCAGIEQLQRNKKRRKNFKQWLGVGGSKFGFHPGKRF